MKKCVVVGHAILFLFIYSLTGMVIGGNVMLGFTTVFDREREKVGFAVKILLSQHSSVQHLLTKSLDPVLV